MKPAPFRNVAKALVASLIVTLSSCDPGEKSESAADAEKPEESALQASDAFLVLPGDYAESTTVADLEARFGSANVRKETSPEPRLVLFPDDATRRAYITFYEEETFEHFAGIRVTDPASRWRGKHGVHIGMTLAEVEKLNLKPFIYWVDDELQRGRAHDGWSPALDDDDGALGAFDVGEGERLYFDLTLEPNDPAAIKATPGLPHGEQVRSNDPRYQRLREVIVVTGIGASSSLDDEWQ